MPTVNSGISAQDRQRLADSLSRALADSDTLSLKTHGYRWNVAGPNVRGLRELFGQQSAELAGAADELAERIRALGHYAPGSHSRFAELGAVPDDGGRPDWQQMIRTLADDQETAIGTCRAAVQVARAADDPVSKDLLTRRLRVHEKHAWMLRAHLR